MIAKIKELFEYRQLPVLLRIGNYGMKSPLVEKLIKLQKSIYDLDTYLESNWDIRSGQLKKHWKEIYLDLSKLGVPKSKMDNYVKYILKYQKHELAMRQGKLPNSFSMAYYYFYKSCDVKLIRQIIYDYIPELKKQYTLSDWRQFDLITEINDDVEDIFEDIDIINGNYFLFEIKENGKSFAGKKFKAYLKQVNKESRSRYKKKKTLAQKQLLDWTDEQFVATHDLVSQQLTKYDALYGT